MKKVLKTTISYLMALAILCSFINVSVTAQTTNPADQLIFRGLCDTHVYDTKYPCEGDLVIPEYYNGLEVTQIWTGALNYTNITSVVIPDTITSFNSGYNFDGCRQLKSAVISNNLQIIPNNAFSNCDVLESVTFGNRVEYIYCNAFMWCPKLEYISLPKSIKEIRSYAFGNTGLKCAYYPGTAEEWAKVNVEDSTIKENVLYASSIEKLENTEKGVKISMTKCDGKVDYIIYRSTYSNGKWSTPKRIKSTIKNVYTDTTVKSGVKYRYSVQTHKSGCFARISATKSTTYLSAPKVSVSNKNTSISVKWNKVKGATRYLVYRRVYSNGKWGSWSKIANTTSCNFSDKTAKSGKNYRYTVKAVKGNTLSGISSSKTLRRLTTPTVKIKKATKGIKISWSKVKGASKYTVYRRVYKSGKWGSWKAVKLTTSSNYVDKTAKKGTTYSYMVKAKYGSSSSYYKASSKLKR